VSGFHGSDLDEMKPLAPTCHCGHLVDRHELSSAEADPVTHHVNFSIRCNGKSVVGRLTKSCDCSTFRSTDEPILGPSR
jgi:hypothetical protein